MTKAYTEYQSIERYIFGGSLSFGTVLTGILQKLEDLQNRDSMPDDEQVDLIESNHIAISQIENILLNSCLPVIVFTMGKPAELIILGLIASIGSIELSHLCSGRLQAEEWDQITLAVIKIQSKVLYFNEMVDLCASERHQQIINILDMLHRPNEVMTILDLKSHA